MTTTRWLSSRAIKSGDAERQVPVRRRNHENYTTTFCGFLDSNMKCSQMVSEALATIPYPTEKITYMLHYAVATIWKVFRCQVEFVYLYSISWQFGRWYILILRAACLHVCTGTYYELGQDCV